MQRSTFALILIAGSLALAACGDDPTLDQGARAQPAPAASAPGDERIDDPALRRLRQRGNRLLDGGAEAFEAELAGLRGTPIVVNQWASWCPPCRAEFPIFQRLAERYAGRVAFLGVDMQDDREAALAFMSELATPYPHYFDEDASISRLFGGGRVSPTTGFYDARGKLVFSHLGAYADDAQLEAEIRRYALR
ncbi:MAG: TlpA family protein disulfide reductase [Solirubrobacterales bacterium]|nr:TlpA family protein disulfide reductase [Solirubrobacterales bacterium]